MLNTKLTEIVVGIFIAIGLAAMLLLAMQVSNLSSLGGDSGYEVRAEFENIGGLKVRSPVKMAGVVIGRVADIQFDSKNYQAVAILRIRPEYNRIPTDTTANVFTAGLLGEQYISLEAGGEEAYLKDGDSLMLTQSAMVLEQVIGQFIYGKAQEGKDGSDG